MPIPTPATAQRIIQLLDRRSEIEKQRNAGGGSRGRIPVLVLCDSDTAATESGIGAQCYSATVLDINANDTAVTVGAPVWLTVLGSTGAPVVPAVDKPYCGLLAGEAVPDGSGTGRLRVYAVEDEGSSLLVSETDTEASTEMTPVDTDEAAPIIRALRRDFYFKKGATAADPKTLAIRYLPPVTFLEKLCPTYKWLTVTDGALSASDADNGGVKVLVDLNPQRKTAKLPGGATVTDVACSGLDTTCCESSWWCTGPSGSPAWTVVEVAYGGTPPAGGYGPYATEADAIAACVDPDDPGAPVAIECCPGVSLPRTITVTEVGGGSFPMVYNATYNRWETPPIVTIPGNLPGTIPLSCGGVDRFILSTNCTVQGFNLDGTICYGTLTADPVVTCTPFSVAFDLYFEPAFSDNCGCEGQTRSFIITE